MDGYNNDYNKDLYTAQSSDFCKSCYSSGKSRAGCLWVLVGTIAVCLVYLVASAVTGSQTAALLITIALAVLFFAINRKKKNTDR